MHLQVNHIFLAFVTNVSRICNNLILSDTLERGSNDRIAYIFDPITKVVTSDATIGHFNLYQPGGGFMCICPDGMKWNEWKRACEDINECQEMTDPCYR